MLLPVRPSNSETCFSRPSDRLWPCEEGRELRREQQFVATDKQVDQSAGDKQPMRILLQPPVRSLGLGCLRFSTVSCCRSAKFSRSKFRRERKMRISTSMLPTVYLQLPKNDNLLIEMLRPGRSGRTPLSGEPEVDRSRTRDRKYRR